MPDKEKVIKGIKCCSILDDNCKDCPYNYAGDGGEAICLRGQLMPDALALLKEREPKTVIITHQNEYCKDGNCPSCGHELDDNMHPKYCGYCGQEVKWE